MLDPEEARGRLVLLVHRAQLAERVSLDLLEQMEHLDHLVRLE
jgi:hypothetical protein